MSARTWSVEQAAGRRGVGGGKNTRLLRGRLGVQEDGNQQLLRGAPHGAEPALVTCTLTSTTINTHGEIYSWGTGKGGQNLSSALSSVELYDVHVVVRDLLVGDG